MDGRSVNEGIKTEKMTDKRSMQRMMAMRAKTSAFLSKVFRSGNLGKECS